MVYKILQIIFFCGGVFDKKLNCLLSLLLNFFASMSTRLTIAVIKNITIERTFLTSDACATTAIVRSTAGCITSIVAVTNGYQVK